MPELPANYPQRRKLPHGIPPWAGRNSILFITIGCTPRGTNHLCHDAVATVIRESLEFRQNRGDWFVHLWLLMPDHLHALISFPKESNPTKIVSGWKEIIAKKTGVAWQRDYFDHRLRSHESHEEKTAYIRNNPVRKGLVREPAEWKFAWEPK